MYLMSVDLLTTQQEIFFVLSFRFKAYLGHLIYHFLMRSVLYHPTQHYFYILK